MLLADFNTHTHSLVRILVPRARSSKPTHRTYVFMHIDEEQTMERKMFSIIKREQNDNNSTVNYR